MSAENDHLRSLVAAGCRILEAEGHGSFTLGHVSARIPGSETIWVKRNGLALGEIGPSEVVAADINRKVDVGRNDLHHEMPIHTGIYQARPEVNCVVHTHARWAAALSASDGAFELVSQDSLPFRSGLGWYDSAELIVSDDQARALAESLGSNRAALLRNHGIVTVGTTVEEAVVNAVELERSFETQALASLFGAVRPIETAEAARMEQYFESSYSGRLQGFWRCLLRQHGPGLAEDLP